MKPEDLDFPVLHCSLDRTLGDYYQDFSPAIALVEGGYHGGLDSEGVPLVHHGHGTLSYNAITTAQYALANVTAVRRGDHSRCAHARAQADWLVAAQECASEWAGCWLMTHDNAKYPWLRAPWVSALASGNAISALLRSWELFGDERYRTAAEAAYRALHVRRSGPGLWDDAGDELWYEEYPGHPPLRVLNGHVYTLLGVADYARVSGDAEADARWRRAARTVLGRLDDFDLGYWSAYDLRFREPATIHYQKNIHVPQLRILGALTGEAAFPATADHWERYLRSPASRLRWAAAIRLRRWTPSQRDWSSRPWRRAGPPAGR